MEAAFSSDDPTRNQFFGSLLHSFGCLYVCLWSYFPHPSDYLISFDGYFNEADHEEPSTSSGNLARRLFDEYRQSIIPLDNGHVPGIAFRSNRPYLELRGPEIQRHAYNHSQRLFYQEARVQTAIFMGCRRGEIELGLTYNAGQMNIEDGLREWFPEDFQRKSPVQSENIPALLVDQSRPPSSSSSSLRSLDSPNVSEYSPLIFPAVTTVNPQTASTSVLTEAVSTPLQQPLIPITASMIQGQQAFFRIREREDEAMTRAILAVLTAPSSPPSTSSSPQKQHQAYPRGSAFKRYYGGGRTTASGGGGASSIRRQSMIKRAISYYHRLNIFRRERFVLGGGRHGGPTTTQLHHMISERKRREKLNESFQALRLLLPQGTKKDKASVLASAREQLASLQGEVSKLIERNRELEAKLAWEREIESLQSDQRFNVRVRQMPESTSDERIADLSVVLRGENVRVDDLVIRLLEFLRQINNVSLVSTEAQTRTQEDGNSLVILVSLRLRIEGEWDESAFQEAVRRVVADLAH